MMRAKTLPLWARESDPLRQQVENVASASKALGLIFFLLGCLPLGIAMIVYGGDPWVLGFASCSVLVLVGPGMWYVAASALLRNASRRAFVATHWIAATHFSTVAGMFFVMVYWLVPWTFMVVPSLLSLLFLPALGAFLVELGRARRVLQPMAHGFTPVMPAAAITESPDKRPASLD